MQNKINRYRHLMDGAQQKYCDPLAVVISDVHYTLNTLELADTAFRAAIDKAAELGVPLIDCGDITNDKAVLRAEIVNRLIDTMQYAFRKRVDVFCLVGNHSLLNEKGKEHALHFLYGHCNIVDIPIELSGLKLIPYQNNSKDFLDAIKQFPKGSIVFAHQGTIGGQLGDYVKDTSAFDPELVKDYKVFLGHYHKHYTLGTTVSIGNPYTLTYGEANDGDKGFLVVYEDGTFTREILELRKHRTLDWTTDNFFNFYNGKKRILYEDGALTWVKISGPRQKVDLISKSMVGEFFGHQNFKLDKIYTDNIKLNSRSGDNLSEAELLDAIIDSGEEAENYKASLKLLWREVVG